MAVRTEYGVRVPDSHSGTRIDEPAFALPFKYHSRKSTGFCAHQGGDYLTKTEFVRFVSEEMHVPMTRVRDAIDVFTEGIIIAIESGASSIIFPGFGEFEIKHRAPRKGRNSSTGEIFVIPATNVVNYKPGKHMKSAVDIGFNQPKKRR